MLQNFAQDYWVVHYFILVGAMWGDPLVNDDVVEEVWDILRSFLIAISGSFRLLSNCNLKIVKEPDQEVDASRAYPEIHQC